MAKKSKKILALVLALVMCLGLLGVGALAEGDESDVYVKEYHLMTREDFQRAIRSRSFVREEMLPHWCSWYIHPYLIRRLSEIFEADPTLPYAREVVQSVREAERQHELDLQRREEQERLAQAQVLDSKYGCLCFLIGQSRL